MCEFCENIRDTKDYDTLEPYIYHGAIYTDGRGYGYHIIVPTDEDVDYVMENILFCPKCGRKLSEVSEHE